MSAVYYAAVHVEWPEVRASASPALSSPAHVMHRTGSKVTCRKLRDGAGPAYVFRHALMMSDCRCSELCWVA